MGEMIYICMYIKCYSGNLRDHFGDLGTDGKIILK
jgi:hypothetical protein